jgi:hypothetical protein
MRHAPTTKFSFAWLNPIVDMPGVAAVVGAAPRHPGNSWPVHSFGIAVN